MLCSFNHCMRIGVSQDSVLMWINMSGRMKSAYITEHYLTAFVHTESFIAAILWELYVNLKV